MLKGRRDMMQPKTLIVMAALWGIAAMVDASFSAQSPSQGEGGPGRMRRLLGEERIQHMAQMLRLSDVQRTQLRWIMKDHESRIAGVENDGGLVQKDKLDKKRNIREITDGRIIQILTPEQQQRFEQSKKIRKKMGLHE